MVPTKGWFSHKQQAQAQKDAAIDCVYCFLLEGNIPLKRLHQHVTEVQMLACPYALVIVSLNWRFAVASCCVFGFVECVQIF